MCFLLLCRDRAMEEAFTRKIAMVKCALFETPTFRDTPTF